MMIERITGGENVTRVQGHHPKKGQHVRDAQHEGVFKVVFVKALTQTANIGSLDGTGHVLPNAPWTALKAAGKE
jgi:hypothetical protein